ncbi:MAG: peptide chain release factor N(5)-glutamine methyltransferase [Saprospiraceae bacterium]
MTWTELRSACEVALIEAGLDRPSRIVLDWFDDVFGLASRRGTEAVPKANLITANAQLERLVNGEPLAYVTGLAHFYGNELEVGEGVLIPRPETEELVRWVLEAFPKHTKLRFADLCTGSGCIAVAISLERLTWRGVAVDVSPHAIAVAEANVRKHDLQEHLQISQADLLVGTGFDEGERFDLIVSNPPYIPDEDWIRVQKSVSDWEPHLALRVSDHEPLIFYRRLCISAKQHLNEGGWLYVECNDVFAPQVAELFSSEGLSDVEVFIDMQGKERHVRGMLN